MTTVYEAANDSAKSELASGNIVSLLDVTVMIVPIDESPGVGMTFGIASPGRHGLRNIYTIFSVNNVSSKKYD